MSTVLTQSQERPDIILDLDRLKNNCSNNLAIVVELLRHLHEKSGPKWIAAIEEGIKSGNGEEVRDVCHGMKGASATIFAWRISNLALEFEYLARDGELQKLGSRLPELQQVFIELKEWVEKQPDFV
jgi:HPt (histidine-containing phosphotransfer) domain-containing protein